MTIPKVAVVTGAGSGIGRELALACARKGMSVVISDVDTAALKETEVLVAAMGAPCVAQRCDVAQPADVERLAEVSWNAWDRVDWLFNNAGVAVLGTAWEATESDWEWVIGVNVLGVARGARAFIPRMLQKGTHGHIVNTASAAGLGTVAGSAVYCASKHAVVAYSECLAKELEQAGAPINVSVLCPSLLPTGILQSQRNRPDSLSHSAPTASAYEERIRAGMAASAIDARDVARMTMEAIEANRFYVIPHVQTGASIRTRTQKILSDFQQNHLEKIS